MSWIRKEPKPTFEKPCKYCGLAMFVETKNKERCFKCKIANQKEFNKKYYDK